MTKGKKKSSDKMPMPMKEKAMKLAEKMHKEMMQGKGKKMMMPRSKRGR